MLLGDACAKCEYISGIPLMPETSQDLHRVYLVRGVRATTAIEGNTLSEDEVARLERGELNLPPSKEYLGIEVQNILDACNDMLATLGDGRMLSLDTDRVKALNDLVLRGLESGEDVVPGEIRTHGVGVARYRGAPARDCEYLLDRLCLWIGEMNQDLGHSKLALPIIKAIIAHLYIAWIHPFGDGNGRTARLVEHQILLNSGIPSPAAHLLSSHYNDTRSEYYRRLDLSSRPPYGATEFMVYALQGFVDGLAEQIERIKFQIWQDTWTNYVHTRFSDRHGVVDTRRRHLVLDLSDHFSPILRRDIRTLSPRLAEAYLDKTNKTITRDLNAVERMGLISRTREGITVNREVVLTFLPLASD